MTEDSIRVTAGRPTTGGHGAEAAGTTGRRGHRGGPLSHLPVPLELLVALATILAILIAAASAENFDAPAAWAYVAFVVAAFLISRGLVKNGRGDDAA